MTGKHLMKPYPLLIALPIVTLLSPVSLAHANVTSKEYKVLLRADHFNIYNEPQQVTVFFQQLQRLIDTSIARKTKGKPRFKTERTIAFYDVPIRCFLRNHGYVLRSRAALKDTELTLKYRSPSLEEALSITLTKSSPSTKSKLEEDIGFTANGHLTSTFSYSNDLDASKMARNLQALAPWLHTPQSVSSWPQVTLQKVSNLTITERVYKGFKIDLGKQNASSALTLWYDANSIENERPIIAEFSFKYKDADGQFSQKVEQRARNLLKALQDMPLSNPNSASKTRLIYRQQANFCQTPVLDNG